MVFLLFSVELILFIAGVYVFSIHETKQVLTIDNIE